MTQQTFEISLIKTTAPDKETVQRTCPNIECPEDTVCKPCLLVRREVNPSDNAPTAPTDKSKQYILVPLMREDIASCGYEVDVYLIKIRDALKIQWRNESNMICVVLWDPNTDAMVPGIYKYDAYNPDSPPILVEADDPVIVWPYTIYGDYTVKSGTTKSLTNVETEAPPTSVELPLTIESTNDPYIITGTTEDEFHYKTENYAIPEIVTWLNNDSLGCVNGDLTPQTRHYFPSLFSKYNTPTSPMYVYEMPDLSSYNANLISNSDIGFDELTNENRWDNVDNRIQSSSYYNQSYVCEEGAYIVNSELNVEWAVNMTAEPNPAYVFPDYEGFSVLMDADQSVSFALNRTGTLNHISGDVISGLNLFVYNSVDIIEDFPNIGLYTQDEYPGSYTPVYSKQTILSNGQIVVFDVLSITSIFSEFTAEQDVHNKTALTVHTDFTHEIDGTVSFKFGIDGTFFRTIDLTALCQYNEVTSLYETSEDTIQTVVSHSYDVNQIIAPTWTPSVVEYEGLTVISVWLKNTIMHRTKEFEKNGTQTLQFMRMLSDVAYGWELLYPVINYTTTVDTSNSEYSYLANAVFSVFNGNIAEETGDVAFTTLTNLSTLVTEALQAVIDAGITNPAAPTAQLITFS